MSIKKVSTEEFQHIIDSLTKRRKHIRYSFQEIGYMLAEKLNDLKHKSLYFNLAKYENRELLMKAFMYAIDAKAFNKGPLFMWKLKQLRQATVYRAFVGLFLENASTVNRTLERQLKDGCYQELVKTNYFVKPGMWHVTLAFWDKLPGSAYMPITRLVEKFKNLYLIKNTKNNTKNIIDITVHKLEYKKFNRHKYIFLSEFDKKIYSLNKTFKQLLESYKGKYKEIILSGLKPRFYPHITIARLKESGHFTDCNYEVNINLDLSLFFTVSKLTKQGPQYKIHSIY